MLSFEGQPNSSNNFTVAEVKPETVLSDDQAGKYGAKRRKEIEGDEDKKKNTAELCYSPKDYGDSIREQYAKNNPDAPPLASDKGMEMMMDEICKPLQELPSENVPGGSRLPNQQTPSSKRNIAGPESAERL